MMFPFRIRKVVSFLTLTLLIVTFALASGAIRSRAAQDNGLISFDDNTPSADITVQPINGKPGVVFMDLENVHVSISDPNGQVMFALLDSRVTGLALQVTGTSNVSLHMERLAGFATASARVIAQPTLPAIQAAASNQPVAALNQNVTGTVSVQYSQSLPVSTTATSDMVSMQFARPLQGLDIFDPQGVVLATMQNANMIGGLALRIAPGQYNINFANSDANHPNSIAVALSQGPTAVLPSQAVALSVQPTQTISLQPTIQPTTATVSDCTVTVKVGTALVRSGPGTQYSAFAFARNGAVIPVSGTNQAKTWIMFQTPSGIGWMSISNVTLGTGCDTVPITDGASSAAPQTQPQSANQINSAQTAISS